MELNKRQLWLSISLIALMLIMSLIGYTLYHNFTTGQATNRPAVCPHMIPNYFLWFSLILMILIIVPISYYTISRKLEEKMEKNLSAITKLVNHKVKSKTDHQNVPVNSNKNILKLLTINEKKVVEKIIENKGSALQSEISRLEGMTKLKTHRAVKELERKGIVKMKQYGKTNTITLTQEIKDVIK